MSCMALNDNKGGDYTVKRTESVYKKNNISRNIVQKPPNT